MSTRIGLLGYYGTRNLGDEAVLEGLLRALESAVPGARAVVYAADPASVAVRPGVEARRLRVRNFAAILRAVGEIDGLLLGGGGILHDYSRLPLLRHVLWALAAKIRQRPVMLAAVGVGPIRSSIGAAQIRAVASLADAVTVRDEKSAEWLRRIGVKKPVEILADPALLLCDSPPQRIAPGSGPVVLALRRWPPFGGDPVATARLLAGCADAIADKLGARIDIVPFHSPGDDVFCSAVLRMVERAESARLCRRPESPRAAMEQLAGARVLVSMRLHGLVLGAAAGTPLVAVACDEKLASFMAALGLDASSLPLPSLEPERAAKACWEAVSARSDSAGRSRLLLEQMRHQAGRIVDVLAGFAGRLPRSRRVPRAG